MAVCSANRLFVGALVHLFAASTALNTHFERQSSHGLRASVFRAASTSAAKTLQKDGHANRQAPVVFTPKVGLANVTKPTAYPPPPASLEPWKDNQPLDTSIGHYFISGFIEQPTVSPPPTQETLDLAFACPILLSWPSQVAVQIPSKCGSQTSGNWTGVKGNNVILQWNSGCIGAGAAPGLPSTASTPVTTYAVSNGIGTDFFGSSQELKTPGGNYITLKDCGNAVVYTVEEKLYKQVGEPHEESCTKYKSCDGIIYVQYFVKNAKGEIVAMTGYTHIFQPSFDITDPAGVKIASVARNGWEPGQYPTDCADDVKKREWVLTYAKSPPGLWGAAINQWPLAAMMQMISARDELRQPDGQILWSNCEVMKTTLMVVVSALFVLFCIVVPCIVVIIFSVPCQKKWREVESRLMPKRMNIPQMYGN